eukprot:212736_1
MGDCLSLGSLEVQIHDHSSYSLNHDVSKRNGKENCSLKQCNGKADLNCEYLHELGKILKYYSEWIAYKENMNENTEKKEDIYDYISKLELGENSMNAIVLILSYYHHLMKTHNNEFEKIYDYFSKLYNCAIDGCNSMRRNHRDRSANRKIGLRSDLYYTYNDNEQVIVQQILDQVHCFFYHTFDIGFKLNKTERKEIREIEKEEITENDDIIDDETDKRQRVRREYIGRIISQKKKKLRQIRSTIDKNNKFTSFYDEIYDEIDDEIDDDDEEKSDDKNNYFGNDILYSFGVRYYYNESKYRNNSDLDVENNIGKKYSDWYIDPKYKGG